jgi:ADP-ribosylglycohydrolase
MRAPRREAFAGSLIGQCLGDALGFVVEGYPPSTCKAYVDGVLRAGRAREAARKPFAFGQYTDDSQLARELARSLTERRGFDPEDYAERVAALFVEDRVVGRGMATERAAFRLAAGVPWDRAGTPPPSAGNGSAMRAGPIGLMFFRDPGRMVQVAHDQGRITHRDRRCSAGAVAIAGAVALALREVGTDAKAWTAQLAEWTQPFDPILASALGRLPEWLARSPAGACAEISKVGLEPGHGDSWEGISPFVTPSVLWSLYSFLRTPDDYWESICTAIAVGGDVDTTAAMTGSISGARVGLAGLPDELARCVNDRGTWTYEELLALAHALKEASDESSEADHSDV